MSERKVLNKYYPPDFDPSNIPKLKLPRNRQYSIRIMAPFNMRCSTCGEYIYKGKKFNSRKETVEDEDYLGLRIFRFYIKCPRCVAEIAFKTDPQNTDYALEDGATRNFEAIRTAEILAKKEQQEKEDAEKDNPMKVLENRTKASQREMEALETLEDLKDQNSRKARVDHDDIIQLYSKYEEMLEKLQDEEDEKFVQSLFGKDSNEVVRRLDDDDASSEPLPKLPKLEKPTDILTSSTFTESQDGSSQKGKASGSWSKSFGSMSKSSLKAMVKKKTPQQSTSETNNAVKKETVNSTCDSDKTKNSVELKEKSQDSQPAVAQPSALGLLGNYSDSESSE